jgi:hypothetical protein
VVPDSERDLAIAHDQLKTWLKVDVPGERGLRLTKIHQLLERQGKRVSYSSLYRYCQRHFDLGNKRLTVRMAEVEPGELAEVDFGRLGYLRDAETGQRRLVWALVVTLVHSRHQYVHLTHHQKIRDVVDGLEAAWATFGGVPRRVVLDYVPGPIIQLLCPSPLCCRRIGWGCAAR